MNGSVDDKKQHYGLMLWAGICACAVLFLCSRSSPLYVCNNWDDANSYFTMGKGLMNGRVIYRDLYDQKGPYLYLLYGIAYLMSQRSFLGVFLLEVIAGTFFLYRSARTVEVMTCRETDGDTRRGSRSSALLLWAAVPVMAAAVYVSKSFYWGGAAEEFLMPLMAWAVYAAVSFRTQDAQRTIIVCGITAGIVALVKYTILGFYAGWIGVIALGFLLRRDVKGCVKACLRFLGGMGIAFLPWLIYFLATASLDDFYRCYIYNNIFFYTNVSQMGLGAKLYDIAKVLYFLILDNFSYFVWLIIGMTGILFLKGMSWMTKLQLWCMIGLLYIGIFIGGNKLPYYSIPLMVFVAPGAGVVVRLVTAGTVPGITPGKENGKSLRILPAVIALALSLVFAWAFSYNRDYRAQRQEGFFLYEFRDIILAEEEPTLLNIGGLDAGVYTLTGIVPTCEYFQANGIALPVLEKEQRRYTRERIPQFVVAVEYVFENVGEGYDLVAEAAYPTVGDSDTHYYLFRRKE